MDFKKNLIENYYFFVVEKIFEKKMKKYFSKQIFKKISKKDFHLKLLFFLTILNENPSWKKNIFFEDFFLKNIFPFFSKIFFRPQKNKKIR